MLHHAPGANCSGYVWWLDNILARNISFDIVGYSYYPRWHGSLSNLEDMLFTTVATYSLDVAVVEAAYYFACEVLKPDGTFIAKVFQGGAQNNLLTEMKKSFKVVKHMKPPASRKESAEQYVVATGFRGSE